MLKKIKYNVYLTKILPVLFTFLIFAGTKMKSGDDDIYTKINRDMDIFGRVYKEIILNYVDEVDPDRFMKAGIDGMLNTLDPYTNFLDETRKDEVELLTVGKYGGIGISIGYKDSMVVITSVMEGYSAQREGLKAGDKILEIEGIPLTGKKVNDIMAMVRGTAGTQMRMKIKRSDREMDFVLTRQEIKLKNVSYYTLMEGGIGYVKLDRFGKNTDNEIVDAINDIRSKGELKGFILDLRDNPGGLLDAAISVLNKFVPKGSLLVTTKGRNDDQEKKSFSNENPLVPPEIPLALLINENSASASEIVAGAVQDLDRGIIVGTKSFGKGLVQVFTPLNYDTQLRITTQKYFTPSGRWIQVKNYFKENKSGVFKPNPLYNQIEFKTLNSRTVFAEGGITPDSVVKTLESNELLDQLFDQDLYFKFADKYINEHPGISNVNVNDDIINEFYNFIRSGDFNYSSRAEVKLTELKSLTDKNNSEKITGLLNSLEDELNQEKLKDFDKSRKQIKRQLEIELLRKLSKSDKDIFFAGFKEDLQLQSAINIIRDHILYDNILNIR